MQSFADIIAAWPSVEEFAADHEVAPQLVAVWKSRNSIPRTHWDRTVAGARARRIAGVSFETLVALARAKSERSPSEAAD